MAGYQKNIEMPPVIGGKGAGYSEPPQQKQNTLPPVIGGSVPGGTPAQERPLVLPPTVG